MEYNTIQYIFIHFYIMIDLIAWGVIMSMTAVAVSMINETMERRNDERRVAEATPIF
jgi:hypothetical protein